MIVGIGGEGQRLPFRLGARRALEQGGIMLLHIAQVIHERLCERFAIGKARKTGEAFKSLAVRRQRVGLLVRNHLQPVFDHAEEAIGRLHLLKRAGANPAALYERRERRKRFMQTQLGMPAAGDELLGLHEELDLTNAAAAELDVVSLDRDLAVASTVDRRRSAASSAWMSATAGVVEMLARRQGDRLAQELVTRRDVAERTRAAP